MKTKINHGVLELRKVLAENWGLFSFICLLSIFFNVLMLTGPVFMLQVYDRVLASGSIETLVALTLLVSFLYLIMGILDYARGRVLSRIATRCSLGLSRRIFTANLAAMESSDISAANSGSLFDLDRLRRLIASPVAAAIFDLPFTPLLLLFLYMFHPSLGLLAVAGGGVIILMSILNQIFSQVISEEANGARQAATRLSFRLQSESETLRGLGMQDAAFDRWYERHVDAHAKDQALTDRQSKFTTFIKSFRLFLQSLMLALGAWLVLKGEMTAGAMIAGSILMGRALQPVEVIVGQWPLLQGAMQSWSRLGALLTLFPKAPFKTELPRPKGHLTVDDVTVIPPGGRLSTLKSIAFEVRPGEVLGVIGSSGSGKTSLARILTGSWTPLSGTVRLDGASIRQYSEDSIGKSVGYLPQTVRLFEGSIRDNIARLQSDATDERIIAAARNASAHDMITGLPMGYNTSSHIAGSQLSGGQIQRIGLARALFGDPSVLVLDEPNASLDTEGAQALEQAINKARSDGRSVVIMTHRLEVLRNCDKLLILRNGRQVACGPRDEILKKHVVKFKDPAKAAKNPGQAVGVAHRDLGSGLSNSTNGDGAPQPTTRAWSVAKPAGQSVAATIAVPTGSAAADTSSHPS